MTRPPIVPDQGPFMHVKQEDRTLLVWTEFELNYRSPLVLCCYHFNRHEHYFITGFLKLLN